MVGTSQGHSHENNLQHKLHHKQTNKNTALERYTATRGWGVG